MVDNPLVSVLMTAHNRANFIKDAIESVLASTYINYELIIVDDCSTDNTLLIAKNYEAIEKRIKVYVNKKNVGDYPNRNIAAGYATGEFLMYVDSDDTILAEGIEKCVRLMTYFTDAGFGLYNTSYKTDPFLLEPAAAVRDHFFKAPFLFVGPGGSIVRRSFFNAVKGYPEKYGPANDMYFNLKAACASPILLLTFPFVNYRRHEGQEINNSISYLYNNYLYLKDAVAELPLQLSAKELSWIKKKNKRRFLFNIIKYLIKTGDIKNVKHFLRITDFGFIDITQAVFQR